VRILWPNLAAAEDLCTALGNCGATLPASVLQPVIAGSFGADMRWKLSGLTYDDRRVDDRAYRDLTPVLRGRVDTCARILGVESVNLVSLAAKEGAEIGAWLDDLAGGLGQFFSPDYRETTFRSGLIPPDELKPALTALTAALTDQSQEQTGEAYDQLWGLVRDCEHAAPRHGVIAGAAVFGSG
jgi:hypothetical protein